MEGRARAPWERIRDAMGTRWPPREAAILPALRVTFAQFEEHEARTRAAVAAAASTGSPVRGSADGRAAFREALAGVIDLLRSDGGDRLVATCLAICSAPFRQMLRERGQLSAARAREAGPAACRPSSRRRDRAPPPSPTPARDEASYPDRAHRTPR